MIKTWASKKIKIQIDAIFVGRHLDLYIKMTINKINFKFASANIPQSFNKIYNKSKYLIEINKINFIAIEFQLNPIDV